MAIPKIIRAITAAVLTTQFAAPYGLTAQQMMSAEPPAKTVQPAAGQSMQSDGMQKADAKPALPSIDSPELQKVPAPQVDLGNRPEMNDDHAILHLLNRFTYGPRPGDVERIRQMGPRKWLLQQLQPGMIDDSALDQRLTAYPAMKLPLDDLIVRYPDNAVIRKEMKGKGGAPGGMAERAIYADRMAKYRKTREKKAGREMDDKSNDDKVSDMDALLADSPQSRFKFLCSLSDDEFRGLRNDLTNDQRQRLLDGFTPQQREQVAAFSNPRQVVTAEVEQTKLLRDIYSERQLNEVMTDFWLNHFNVYMGKSQEAPYYIADYEKNVVRPRAMGYFEDLLDATAESPAMLNYLDNSESIGPHSVAAQQSDDDNKKAAGLNENYAREVMELHTVGVNGGYTQHDVTELAKVFTGWTIENQNSRQVRAVFDFQKHEGGTKIVLDVRIKDNGEKEGMQMLHILATNPHTAHFISQKLAVRFVSDDPPPTLVNRMADAFLKSNGNIRVVLATMIGSKEFWADSAFHSKVKTPQDYIVSAIRASGAEVESAGALDSALTQLGMPLFGHQTPDGYSMRAEAWNSTAALIARLNFAFALSSNRINGVSVNWDAMLGHDAATMTPTQKESMLEAKLLHIPVAPRTRQTILKAISGNADQDQSTLKLLVTRYQPKDPLTFASTNTEASPLDPQAALAAGFLIGSPEFQRR